MSATSSSSGDGNRLPVLEPGGDRAADRGSHGEGASGRSRFEQGMNFGAVLRATRGEREDLPPPPDFEEPPADLSERCRRALYEVSDPEFPISLVDLGLVYGIEADEARGVVTVRLTFTATACPCMDFIEWDVRERLLDVPGVREVEIEVVWHPPWSTDRITDRGRKALARAGVSV